MRRCAASSVGESSRFFRWNDRLVDVSYPTRHNEPMSTVEDIRQIFQDFLAPELRTITARLDGLDGKVDALRREFDGRFDGLRREIDLRFENQSSRLETALAKQDTKLATLEGKFATIEGKLDAGLASIEGKADARFATLDGKIQQVLDNLDVSRRLQRLEEKQSQPAA